MRRGSITVFMSLMLAALLVLSLVLSESARVSGLRYLMKQAGNSAIDSLYAGYNRKLLDEYGLLFLDGGNGKGLISEEELCETFLSYFRQNAGNAELLSGASFFRLSPDEAELTDIVTATDYSGGVFIRSALAYYKYERTAGLLTELQSEQTLIEEGESAKEKAEQEISEQDLTDEAGDTDWEAYREAVEESPVGEAEKLRKKGWIQMVIPSGRTISAYSIDTGDFPSITAQDDREAASDGTLSAAAEKLLFNEYLLSHFLSFTDTEERAGVQYELEYILGGKDSDEANLRAALNRLLLLREGMNILHILSSESKMSSVSSMAAAIAGWTGLAPVIALTETSLIAAWSFAESLLDLRELLAGGKVPLLKEEKDWSLSLEGVCGFLKGEDPDGERSGEGLSYRDYIRLFLYREKTSENAYRAMDMIQARMRLSDSAFLMVSQIYALQIRAEAEAEPLFTGLGAVKGLFGLSGAENYVLRDWFAESY